MNLRKTQTHPRRPRVGIVTTWFARGAGYVSKAYMEALRPTHEVFVYARGGEMWQGDSHWDGRAVTWAPRLPMRPGPLGSEHRYDFDHYADWLLRNHIDVVLFNEERNFRLIDLTKRLGALAGAYVDYYTRRSRPLFRIYDFLICNTHRHLAAFADHPAAHYVPWGTDIALFRPSETHDGHAPVRFFHSAGMSPYRKGTDLVLRALTRVRGNCRLIIHTQEPLPRHKIGDAVELVHDPRVEVRCGTVEPPGLYHEGDVYVYPSRLDGIGLTLPEALASGLAAIAPDEPPMNEFVADGTGLLVPVARRWRRHDDYYWPACEVDAEPLAAAMQQLVDDPSRVAPMQRAARRHAEAQLDWRKNAAELAALPELTGAVRARRTMTRGDLAWLRVQSAAVRGLRAVLNPLIRLRCRGLPC